MNKKEIVKMLEELAIGVQDKRDVLEIKLNNSRFNKALYHDFEISLEHTEGQLYEINYILGVIIRDNRKRDY